MLPGHLALRNYIYISVMHDMKWMSDSLDTCLMLPIHSINIIKFSRIQHIVRNNKVQYKYLELTDNVVNITYLGHEAAV